MALPTLESLVERVGIPLTSLDQRCSDEHILSISSYLDWRNVAPYLGLSEVDIEDIDCDGRSQPEKRLKTLRKWKTKYGYGATFKNLVRALLKVENTDHAEKVCRLLQSQEQTGPSQASGREPAASTSRVVAQNPVRPSSSSTGGSAGTTEDTLGVGDLFDVKCYLLNLDRTNIYNLGLALGLNQPKVKMWKESDTFLDDVLAAWLNREDDVEKKGMPSWRTLVKALRHPVLNQTGVANDICRDKGL